MDEYFNLLMDSIETPGDVNFRSSTKLNFYLVLGFPHFLCLLCDVKPVVL